MKKIKVSKATKITTKIKSGVSIQTKTLLLLSMFLVSGMAMMAVVGLVGKNKASSSPSIGSVNFTLKLPELKMQNIEQEKQVYTKLSFDNESSIYPTEAGVPQIPYLHKMLAIPDQATNIKLSYKVGHIITKKDVLVYPTPKIEVDQEATNRSKEINGEAYCDCFKEVFYKQDAVYANDILSPKSIVTIVGDSYMRSQRMLELSINSLQYNPKQKALQQVQELEVTVTYSLNKSIAKKVNKLGREENFAKSLVINPQAIELSALAQKTVGSVSYLNNSNLLTTSNNIDYLIITHGDFFNSTELNTLANYRASNDNYRVGVVKVSDIYTVFPQAQNDQSIRNFLQYAYDNWQVAPSLLLLLGDTEWVPTHTEDDSTDPVVDVDTDKWFTYVSGVDKTQDIAVGRLSVRTVTDIASIFYKIQNYEQTPIVVGDYHYRVPMIDGTDFSYEWYNLWRKLDAMGFDIVPVPDAYEADVINNFAGNMMGYYNHGNITLWELVDEWFDYHDFSRLGNNNQNPFIFSGGCRTLNISNSPNIQIAEELVMLPVTGAVGMYGPTSLAWSFIPGDFLIDNAKDNLEYRAGFNTWYGEMVSGYMSGAENGYLLQSDPGLHLFGQGSSPLLPDPAIAKSAINFDQARQLVNVTIRNLGGSTATSAPVELYADIAGSYRLQSSRLVTVPAYSSVVVEMPIVDFKDLILGTNLIKVLINSTSNVNHIVESFPFNNTQEVSVVMSGVNSVISILNSNNEPVGVSVKVFDSNGTYLGYASNDGNQLNFESLPGQALKFEAWSLFDTLAGPGNPTVDCLSDESGYMTAPANATLKIPTPSYFIYRNTVGLEEKLRFLTAKDSTGRLICSNVASGQNMNMYIKPGILFRVGQSFGTQFWSSLSTAPSVVYYCADGSCCVDGTATNSCSTSQPKYCSGTNLINDCQQCGCAAGLCQLDGTCKILRDREINIMEQ